ncbi:MAG: bifunctional [glutamine synthetase] adenylyltransferase/[glutamine synthetase]-adenylyl-L-tyrosine phosphorylase [Pseudomonadota bacterium]
MAKGPFKNRIKGAPRPYDPERGAEALAQFGEAGPGLSELLSGAAGSSPYLAGLIGRESDWAREALSDAPEAALEDLLSEATGLEGKLVGSELRRLKGRAALLIALADLGGVWDLEKTTLALTRFAETALGTALRAALAPLLRRGAIPGQSEANLGDGAGLVVIGMGKLGAWELNYSSDIDLICLYDETRFDPDEYADARAGFVKATRAMAALLSEINRDGYVFRTDLRLRPDAAVTPVAMAMEAAERYYEGSGRTWERAAHIKARPIAGDLKAGAAYLKQLEPFVWRRHLDFWAIEDAHAMRQRIRDAKVRGGIQGAAGHDLKLGAGGIREIEFFTQTRQLIFGGRDRSLRPPGTVAALNALAAAGQAEREDAATLVTDYRAHRVLEHRIQMVADQQTHSLPKAPGDFARLAALADRTPDALAREVEARLHRVHGLTEPYFAPAPAETPGAPDAGLPDLADDLEAVTARWPGYPALRSTRAAEIFARVRPQLLERLNRAADPSAALTHLDGFLAGLPAGVQVFSLFDANPHLLDLIVDIADIAPGLAGYLSRNAAVFDAVIGGAFFAAWPGRDALARELGAALARAEDYEAGLDAARVWAREWRFRTGVHHLRGLISSEEAGWQYADLARAVLAGLWPVVEAEFARRHGPPPGRGAAVIGMGSLGAGALTATSDLDLIVIFDADDQESSTGPKPLAYPTYYARLTQAFVTALTAPTGAGRLYEVDMRLRPSGRKGPVATGLGSFQRYQAGEAWSWEHMALTRARAVAGSERLSAEFEAFRRELLSWPRERATLMADLSAMRGRVRDAEGRPDPYDLKVGPGFLADIELLAAAAALLAGSPARGAARQLAAGAIDASDADALARTHRRLAETRQALTLVGHPPLPGTGAAAFVSGGGELEGHMEDLQREAAEAAQLIAVIVGED